MTDPTATKRPGRRAGSVNKITQKAREEAMASGDLPHMWLLRVMRGEEFEEKHISPKTGKVTTIKRYPTLIERIDAAKAAAPYFAPKLAIQQLTTDDDKIKEAIAGATSRMLSKLDAVMEEGNDSNGQTSE